MKRYLLPVFIGLLNCLSVKGQDVFDPSIIHQFEINFYDSNWDHLLDSLATEGVGTGSGTGRILANVVIDGIQYDSCGVRYKGNSSMDTTSNKNPFNIDLNYVIPGQEHQGKDKFKLANCFTDPSMIREALTYELANQYMDCPKANFTKLYINGGYRGLYTNTESIDNEFLSEHYGSSKNPFFKCDPVSFELFGDNSNLAYHPDSMAYDTLYGMKSTFGLAALQAFTYELEFNPSTIENYLDVDRALWFLAISSAFVHNDGYTAFAHNFYIYKQDNGRWSIILWDVNMAFGGLLWNGTNVLPLGIVALQQQDPFIHISPPGFRPLIAQLLSIPKYKKMYIAHYKTIIDENIANNYYFQRAQWWHNLIDAEVPNEPYPFYTYQDFQDNLTTDYGNWIDLRPGLQNLMNSRLTYLNSLPEFQATQPIITNVSAPNLPPAFSNVTVTAEVINEVEVWLGYRDFEYDVFTKVQMFDDGAHNDGSANDDIYGADIPIQSFDVQYYVYAENAESSEFFPERAEYEFLTISPKKDLVINELCADNQSIVTDQTGAYEDWIELYNNSTNAIDVGNYFLSDDPANIYKWAIPSYVLQPGEFFVLFADNDILDGPDHTNFGLSATGEDLILSTLADSIVDMVSFPAQLTDITYGRLPNGDGPFNYLLPTYGTENSTLASNEEHLMVNTRLYPNPAASYFTIEADQWINSDILIFDLNGRLVNRTVLNGTQLTIDVSDLSAGTYVVKIGSGQSQKLIIR